MGDRWAGVGMAALEHGVPVAAVPRLQRLAYELVEWRGATELLDLPSVTYGHEGVRQFWRLWTETWTDIRVDVEEVIELDDGILGLIRWRARSPAGLELDQKVAFQFEIHDELLTRFISYWERSQAFDALGLPTHG